MKIIGTLIGVTGLFMSRISKDKSKSENMYKKAIKHGTKNSIVLTLGGLTYLRENNPKEAKIAFDRAMDSNSKVIPYRTLKAHQALCQWKLGDVDAALTLYDELIDFYKNDHYTLESYSVEQENIDKFIDNNPILLEEDLTTIGYLYIEKEEYDKAKFYTMASLKCNENSSSAYDNLGQIYYNKNEYDKALTHFNSALEIKPTLADSLFYVGMIHKKTGDINDAKEFFNRALNSSINGLNTITGEDVERELHSLD